MADERVLNGRRFGVLGKGGAGKSTTVVLLAQALRRQGYPVCILDADSTNFGLHSALGIDDPPRPLLEYFGGMVFSGGDVTCPVDDPARLMGADLNLDMVASDYYRQNPDGVFLLTAGKIGDKGPGAGCDGPISKIARDVRFRLGSTMPVTLVDFKAGFEDAARGVVTSLDWVLVVVDPTTAAIHLAIEMKRMVEQIKAGNEPATDHLESPEMVDIANRIFSEATTRGAVALLNRVRDGEMLDYLVALLSSRGVRTVGMIPEDPATIISWLVGAPLASVAQTEMNLIVDALEALDSEYATGTKELITC